MATKPTPFTKANTAKYMSSANSSGPRPQPFTRQMFIDKYYSVVPVGMKGPKKIRSAKTTRAQNPNTVHHFHASNRLAAAARIDAWGHKGQARGQR